MDYLKIITDLENLADKKWAEDPVHIKIINTQNKILGVRTPDLKKYSNKIANLGIKELISALKDTSFEETLLCGLLIGKIKDIDECYAELARFLPRIDNWATCDQTVAALKVFKKDKDNKYFEKFAQLSKSSKEFYARFGIIMLMTYYLKDETIDNVLNLLKEIKNKLYYVQMAEAWLISIAFIKYRDKTLNLLKAKSLEKFVQNKAISKCHDSFRVSTEDKVLLKEYRIK